MGTLDREDFRDAVQFNLDNRGDLTDAQLNRWIYWAYLHVSQPNVYRHRELEAGEQYITLISGTDIYAFPALTGGTVGTVYDVFHYLTTTNPPPRTSVRRKLVPEDVREFDTHRKPEGRPDAFGTWGNAFELDRVPTAAEAGQLLAFRAYLEPAEFLNDAAVTLLRPLWDNVIVTGATWRGWEALNRPDRAEVWKDNFGRMVFEVVNILNVETEDPDNRVELDYQTYQRM